MKELVRTADPVFLSWLLHRLGEQGIEAEVFGNHTAGAYPGIEGLESRVMVAEDDHQAAELILAEAPD